MISADFMCVFVHTRPERVNTQIHTKPESSIVGPASKGRFAYANPVSCSKSSSRADRPGAARFSQPPLPSPRSGPHKLTACDRSRARASVSAMYPASPFTRSSPMDSASSRLLHRVKQERRSALWQYWSPVSASLSQRQIRHPRSKSAERAINCWSAS